MRAPRSQSTAASSTWTLATWQGLSRHSGSTCAQATPWQMQQVRPSQYDKLVLSAACATSSEAVSPWVLVHVSARSLAPVHNFSPCSCGGHPASPGCNAWCTLAPAGSPCACCLLHRGCQAVGPRVAQAWDVLRPGATSSRHSRRLVSISRA